MSARANATRRAAFLAPIPSLSLCFFIFRSPFWSSIPLTRMVSADFLPKHFTLDWYRQLFRDASIWDSFLNSLLVAVAAVVLALTLGLLAALALDRADFPGKSIFRRLVLLPLILPGIITGLSLLHVCRLCRHFNSASSPFSSAMAPRSSPSPPPNSSPACKKWIARRKKPLSTSAPHLANLLACHASQSQALSHRRRTPHLHPLHG